MKHINLEGTHKVNLYLPRINSDKIRIFALKFIKQVPVKCEVSVKVDLNYELTPKHINLLLDLLKLDIQDMSLNVNTEIMEKLDENQRDQITKRIWALGNMSSLKIHNGSEDYHLTLNKLDDHRHEKLQHALDRIFSDSEPTFESEFIDDIEVI